MLGCVAVGAGGGPVEPAWAQRQPAAPAWNQLAQSLNNLGAEGQGHGDVMAAMQSLLRDPPSAYDWQTTLGELSQADPRAGNWLRMLAARQLANEAGQGATSFIPMLATYVADRDNDPAGRYLVYQTLVSQEPDRQDAILDEATDDPSLPLRYLAIDRRLKQLKDSDSADASAYQTLLPLARHPDHVREVAFRLKDLGLEVNLAEVLGMFDRYLAVAGFNNADGVGFDTVYQPEQAYLRQPLEPIDSQSNFALASGQARWRTISTDESMGMMDLNPVYDNQKNAVAYVFARFELPADSLSEAIATGGTQARLGCINANKVWVNGELVLANEVYHSGTSVDQYVGGCELRPGLNTVLLKICQNDQPQSWAQDWKFQLRFTDQTGKGLPVTIIQPSETSDEN